MKKTIGSLRISEKTLENMKSALKKLNKMNITDISFQEYRRLSYEFFSQMVLQEKEAQIKKLLQK